MQNIYPKNFYFTSIVVTCLITWDEYTIYPNNGKLKGQIGA